MGGNVRGNMRPFTSDTAMTGVDSAGGMTCDAFASFTDDEIFTKNDSIILGTDTSRAEVI